VVENGHVEQKTSRISRMPRYMCWGHIKDRVAMYILYQVVLSSALKRLQVKNLQKKY